MKSFFCDKINFNSDISNWNVSNVTDMSLMFCGATSMSDNNLKSFYKNIEKLKNNNN